MMRKIKMQPCKTPLAPCVRTSLLVLAMLWSASWVSGQTQIDETSLLMEKDREFDRTTAEKGLEGWVSLFAPNGSMLADTSKPVLGPAEIRRVMEPVFADTSYSLRWEPQKAGIMIPGVLGYTSGRYERKRRNKEGRRTVSRGSYTSVWKKQPDGSWKIILDTGQPDGPPNVVE